MIQQRHHQVTLRYSGYDRRISVNRETREIQREFETVQSWQRDELLIAEDKSNAATLQGAFGGPQWQPSIWLAVIWLPFCGLLTVCSGALSSSKLPLL